MVLLGETGVACLEPLGLRCFCVFAGLLKHHKIAEGDSEIVDIALQPNLWRSDMQREPRTGLWVKKIAPVRLRRHLTSTRQPTAFHL